jgi:hypothetical protein
MSNDALVDMVCPKCGSPDWKETTGLQVFLTGLAMAGCGIWLIIFIIGIPMVLAGLALMAVGPFAGTVYQCQRCKKTWRSRNSERAETKKGFVQRWCTGPLSPWKERDDK